MTAAAPRSGRARWLAAATLLLYGLHAADYWVQINDDAFITFRYSRFLAEGRGPYFNDGEHVEGFTNFLMMPLIAIVIAVAGPDAALPAAKVIGVAAGLAALVASRALCRRWLLRLEWKPDDADALSWIAAALVAVQTGFMLNTTTGLETSLFSAWIALGLCASASSRGGRRSALVGGLFALAALTRPEGVAVFGVVVACRLAAGAWRMPAARRDLAIEAGIVAAAVAAMLLLRSRLYDGEWLPNTYYAKAEGMGGRTAGGYLWDMAARHFGYVLWIPAFVAPLVVPRAVRGHGWPAVGVAAFAVVSVFLTGPDWMPGYRLVAPYIPVWAALTALVAATLLRRRPRVITAAAIALPLLFAAVQVPIWLTYRHEVRVRAGGYRRGHMALARWLNEQKSTHPRGAAADRSDPPDSGGDESPSAHRTVALMDIGIVGFMCPQLRVLDITGLTDRTIAKSPGRFLDKQFDPSYVFDQRPEYLVIIMHAPLNGDGSDDLSALSPWTPIEERLLAAPAFVEHYFRPSPPPDASNNQPADAANREAALLTRYAALLGAERVFRHDYPGYTYLLVVYRAQKGVRE